MTETTNREALVAALKTGSTLQIHSWGDAARFLGIEIAGQQTQFLAERVYCQVTAEGKALLQDYWGVGEVEFYGAAGEFSSWGDPALGYVWLQRTELFALAICCASRKGEHVGFVWYPKVSNLVLVPTKEYLEAYKANRDMLHGAEVYEFGDKHGRYHRLA